MKNLHVLKRVVPPIRLTDREQRGIMGFIDRFQGHHPIFVLRGARANHRTFYRYEGRGAYEAIPLNYYEIYARLPFSWDRVTIINNTLDFIDF